MKSLSNFGFLAVSPSEPGLEALKPAAGGALGPEWDIVATGQSCWQRNLWAWFNRPPTFYCPSKLKCHVDSDNRILKITELVGFAREGQTRRSRGQNGEYGGS